MHHDTKKTARQRTISTHSLLALLLGFTEGLLGLAFALLSNLGCFALHLPRLGLGLVCRATDGIPDLVSRMFYTNQHTASSSKQKKASKKGRTTCLDTLERCIRESLIRLLEGILGRLHGALFILGRRGKRPGGSDTQCRRHRPSNSASQLRGRGRQTREE